MSPSSVHHLSAPPRPGVVAARPARMIAFFVQLINTWGGHGGGWNREEMMGSSFHIPLFCSSPSNPIADYGASWCERWELLVGCPPLQMQH